MILLSKLIQKALAKKIKNNFLAKMIGEKELNLIFEELKMEFVKSDVNYEVATKFFEDIKKEIKEEKKIFVGREEVQLELYKKIKQRLIASLGQTAEPIKLRSRGKNKFLLVGVNGVGKTTTVAKLAYYLKTKKGVNLIETVSLDATRAAAFQQLEQLTTPLGVKSHFIGELSGENSLQEYEEGLKNKDLNAVIYDSGGILPKDDKGLEHLKNISSIINPTETFLVLDALSGQDSFEIVKLFCENINIDSLIVTKSDSMSPLGAALSAHYFFNLPIKFLGEGEGIKDLEAFYPDRIVSKLLGEGDIKGLSDKIADKPMNIGEAQNSIFNFLKGEFDLEDLMVQLREIRKIGSLSTVFKFLPKTSMFSEKLMSNSSELESEFQKWEYLIQSMTSYEKKNPKILKTDSSRRSRVIRGSGRKPEELNRLISKWEITKKKSQEIGQKLSKGNTDIGNLFDLFK